MLTSIVASIVGLAVSNRQDHVPKAIDNYKIVALEGSGRSLPLDEFRRQKYLKTAVEGVLASERGDLVILKSNTVQIPACVLYSRTYPRVQKLRYRRLLMEAAKAHPRSQSFEFRLLPEEIQSYLSERSLRLHPEYSLVPTTLVSVGPAVISRVTYEQKVFDLTKMLGSPMDPEGRALAKGGVKMITDTGEVARRRELGKLSKPTSGFQCTVEFPQGSSVLERQISMCKPLLDRYIELEDTKIVAEYRKWLAEQKSFQPSQLQSLFSVFDYKDFAQFQQGNPRAYNDLRRSLYDYAEAVGGEMQSNIGSMISGSELSASLSFSIDYMSFDDGGGNLLQFSKRTKSFGVIIGD